MMTGYLSQNKKLKKEEEKRGCSLIRACSLIRSNTVWAIPQKRLPQGEKIKVTDKVCFPLKINEEGLHFDDEVKTF